jgi:hypothetical protein
MNENNLRQQIREYIKNNNITRKDVVNKFGETPKDKDNIRKLLSGGNSYVDEDGFLKLKELPKSKNWRAVKREKDQEYGYSRMGLIGQFYLKTDGCLNFLISKHFRDDFLYSDPQKYISYMKKVKAELDDEIKLAQDVLDTM